MCSAFFLFPVAGQSQGLGPDVIVQAEGGGYAPDSILVKFRPAAKASDKAQARALINAASHRGYGIVKGLENLRLKPGQGVIDAVDKLSRLPFVAYAEPDYLVQKAATNDAYYYSLYAIENTGQSVAGSTGTVDADMDVLEAWTTETGSADLIIAVIDEGVVYNHPDLAANMWTNVEEIPGDGIDNDLNGFVDDVYGYDFFSNDGDPMDEGGHGTHVAGTICADANNGIGIAGVVQQCKIMALRFLGPTGGDISDGIASLDYAVQMGATISNNSWGGGGFSQALYDSITAARDADHVFLAAAGNDGTNNDSVPHYPSNYDLANVVSVAATDNRDARAGFSNYGAVSVDIGAPGVSILSTVLPASRLTVGGGSYTTYSITGSPLPAGELSSTLINCGLGTSTCSASGGNICLIERGDITFEEKALACQAGGGSAAVIFNNLANEVPSWVLSSPTAVSILTVGVTQADGQSLLSQVGNTATIESVPGYGYKSGTSMATPNVAGVVALIRSQNPGWSYQQVIDHLYATGRPAASMAGVTTTGKIANAAAAVAAVEPPAPPAAPSGLMADSVSENSVTLSWADNADNETGFVIERNGQTLSLTIGANTLSFTDGGLSGATTYNYRVKARNTAGDSDWSNAVDATTASPPPYQTVRVSAETTLAGSVITGSYTSTFDHDDVVERIRERESGGKKNRRYSYLEHRWTLSAPAGAATLSVTGYADNSSDGDAFELAYSTGGTYTPLCQMATGSSSTCTAGFELANAGTVTLRVTDTNQDSGNRALDSVYIDQIELFVESNTGPVTPPSTPEGLSGNASPGQIALSWTDTADNETRYKVQRSDDGNIWSLLASLGANAVSYVDISVASLKNYYYQVVAVNSGGDSPSDTLAITSAEQVTPSITLVSASGSKVKGWQQVEAVWTAGGSSVTLYRDSTPVYSGVESPYTDTRISKGGATYRYQVCPEMVAPGEVSCSNTVTVTF